MDPFSILNSSISSFKNFIENEFLSENSKAIIDASFLKDIENENFKLVSVCNQLNSDVSLVQKLNSLIDNSAINAYYKTERFFLSEIIDIFVQNQPQETEKAKFVLAYYYDALRNGHFAEVDSVPQFNKLVTSPDFDKIIQDVISKNKLMPKNPENKEILLSVLSEMKHPKFQEMFNHFETFRTFSGFPKIENFEPQKLIFEEKTGNGKVETNNINVTFAPEDDTLEKVLEELKQLIGLEEVKKDVNELVNLLKIQKKRDEEGLKNVEISLHTVFLGPPGTGKTTVARLLSRIYKQLGYLSRGQLYETDREGLVAGYVGQTATKVDKAVQESLGGVLFIDEAYGLSQNTINDFGSEAVNTLIKRMEDYRDDLAVVVAGYTKPMQQFIESNPGIRSRFNRYFYFEHFTAEQLMQIFRSFCKQSDFEISESAVEKLQTTFNMMNEVKNDSFGNARVVRNLFETCVQNQANRLILWTAPKNEFLKTFYPEDIPEPKDTVEKLKVFEKD